jgi:hypothetical protein
MGAWWGIQMWRLGPVKVSEGQGNKGRGENSAVEIGLG